MKNNQTTKKLLLLIDGKIASRLNVNVEGSNNKLDVILHRAALENTFKLQALVTEGIVTFKWDEDEK